MVRWFLRHARLEGLAKLVRDTQFQQPFMLRHLMVRLTKSRSSAMIFVGLFGALSAYNLWSVVMFAGSVSGVALRLPALILTSAMLVYHVIGWKAAGRLRDECAVRWVNAVERYTALFSSGVIYEEQHAVCINGPRS